jgi:hypothetical protein
MTISISSALSFASALSDGDTRLPDQEPLQVRMNLPTSWAEAVSRDPSVRSRTTDYSSLRGKEEDLLSDLASSRAEVEELRAQVALLHKEKKLTEEYIAKTIREQVAMAMQQQPHKMTTDDSITQHQFRGFMESQNRRFDNMTVMFRQYMSAAAPVPPPASKRSADDAYGQASADGDSKLLTMRNEEVQTPKRVNDRSTPSIQSSVVEAMQSLYFKGGGLHAYQSTFGLSNSKRTRPSSVKLRCS